MTPESDPRRRAPTPFGRQFLLNNNYHLKLEKPRQICCDSEDKTQGNC